MTATWQESYDKPRQCVENKDFTLPSKACIVKAMVFPVVMYGCESWTIKVSAEELTLSNCGAGEDS